MDIDLLIVMVFLVTTLAIGLYCSRGVTTFKDYAVGNRKMSTFVITISMIATIYGGGNLTYKINDYACKGLYMLIRDLTGPVSFYLASRFIILRMKEFMEHLSIAESMGNIYGQVVRVLTAIFGVMKTIALVTAQFKVGIKVSLLLFPEIKAFSVFPTIIIGLLVIFYSTFGGARAVALTDVYQFFLFGVCFPILIFTFLYHSRPSTHWKNFIMMPQFDPVTVCTWNNTLKGALATFIWHAVFPFDPARVQRVYMSSSVQQAAQVFLSSAVIRIIFPLLFLTIVVVLYAGGHRIPPDQDVLDYIIRLAYFPGIKGLLITAIIALLMSTADSNLHVASVLCVNDLWPFLFRSSRRFHKPSLTTVRITCSLIGLISIFSVLYTTSILQLLNKSTLLYSSVITVPFLASCFGFRPRSAAVLSTMGISTAITAYHIFVKVQRIGQKDIFKSLVLSALILLVMHYLLPKQPGRGWVGIQDYSPIELQNQENKRWWLRKLYYFQSIFTKSYWKDIFPKSATTFIASGIYFIIYSSILLCYVKQVYGFAYIYWYIAVMAIGTIVTLYPTLHAYKQEGNSLLHGLWPILLGVVLFIAGITYMKLSHFSPMSCALFIVNIGVSSLLLPCTIMIVMLSIALLIYRWVPPYVALMNCKESITTESVVGLTILVGCLPYRYLRNKANRQLQTIALTRSHERSATLESIYNQANWARLDPTYNGKVLQEMSNMLQPYIDCDHTEENLKATLSLHVKKLNAVSRSLLQRAKEERALTLNAKVIKQVCIDPIILKAYETTKKLGKPVQLLLRNHAKATHIIAEPDIFERLLTINLWEISQSRQAIDHIVTITITNTFLRYDHAKEMDNLCNKKATAPLLPALAFCIATDTGVQNGLPIYDVTDDISTFYLPKTTSRLYQAESRQIVQAHGGYVEITDQVESLTCIYVFPIDGKKVMRLKKYDTADLFNEVAETVESLAQEKELISLLVKKTTLTEKTVQETINFIKQAHGTTVRKSGEPYYTHPMEVAKIVLEVTKNADTILAALLHDVVEDTTVTLERIELQYGLEVAYIVDMVTHYNTSGYRWKLDSSDNQVILSQCKDIRIIYVKLADRLHNLRTITVRKPIDRVRIAKETLSFYIPWARKNNIIFWLPEMENICEQILHVHPTLCDS